MSEQLPALENTSSYGQCFLYSKPRHMPPKGRSTRLFRYSGGEKEHVAT